MPGVLDTPVSYDGDPSRPGYSGNMVHCRRLSSPHCTHLRCITSLARLLAAAVKAASIVQLQGLKTGFRLPPGVNELPRSSPGCMGCFSSQQSLSDRQCGAAWGRPKAAVVMRMHASVRYSSYAMSPAVPHATEHRAVSEGIYAELHRRVHRKRKKFTTSAHGSHQDQGVAPQGKGIGDSIVTRQSA